MVCHDIPPKGTIERDKLRNGISLAEYVDKMKESTGI
jgi:hypothetical protein